MPELPEVETVRAGIERFVVGRLIVSVEIIKAKILRKVCQCATTR